MTATHPELLEAFCRSIRPPSREPPDLWAARHVRLNSDLGEFFDPDASPALRQPLRRMFDNTRKEVCLVAPPGIGKTTLFEAALCYLASEDPGDCLIASKNEELLEQWLDTRLHPILNRCEPLREYLPRASDRQKKLLLLRHMFIAARAANESSLQQTSVRYCFLDEAWMYAAGMIGYARKRLHDRWNGRTILVSQAGYAGSEWDIACSLGDQHRYHWCCTVCGGRFPFEWKQVRWNGDEEKAALNWPRIRETTRLGCPACDAEYPDTAEARRALVTAAEWVKVADGEEPAHETYVVPAMANFRVPWSRLVREFLTATAASKLGDKTPLFQFFTQRLSQFWKETFDGEDRPALKTALYSWRTYEDGRKVEGEAARFLTIDRQADHWWCLIRCWREDMSSRLVFFGKLRTEEELRALQHRYGVEDRHVFQDSAYDTAAVYAQCAKFGWFAIQGTGESAFEHPKKDLKGRLIGKEYKMYSRIREVTVGRGVTCRLIFLASERLKDVTAHLRDGKGPLWEVPGDVGSEYALQVMGETKKETLNAQKRSEWKWVKTSANHAFDCCYYNVFAAIAAGILSI